SRLHPKNAGRGGPLARSRPSRPPSVAAACELLALDRDSLSGGARPGDGGAPCARADDPRTVGGLLAGQLGAFLPPLRHLAREGVPAPRGARQEREELV